MPFRYWELTLWYLGWSVKCLPIYWWDNYWKQRFFSLKSTDCRDFRYFRWYEASEGRLNNYKGKPISNGAGCWCANKRDDVVYRSIQVKECKKHEFPWQPWHRSPYKIRHQSIDPLTGEVKIFTLNGEMKEMKRSFFPFCYGALSFTIRPRSLF